MAKQNTGGVEPRKVELGEVIKFESVVLNQAFTQFGETTVAIFADENDMVIRKVMSNSLGKFLRSIPNLSAIKGIKLAKKIKDGDMTHNVWETIS